MATHFSFNTSRKYILAMMKLFNGITTQRIVDSEIYENNVPIVWGSKERYNMHTDEAYEASDKGIQLRLPKMALTLDSIDFDSTRKTNKFSKKVTTISDTFSSYQYNPVPYTYSFTLNIITKTLDDYFQIIEQILPYYNPSKHINIIEIPEQDSTSIKVAMTGVTFEPDIDYDENGNQRLVNGSIGFTLDGNMYMPIKDLKIINDAFAKYVYEFNTETKQFDEFLTPAIDSDEDGNLDSIGEAQRTHVIDDEYIT